jgi:hypothetical protein
MNAIRRTKTRNHKTDIVSLESEPRRRVESSSWKGKVASREVKWEISDEIGKVGK